MRLKRSFTLVEIGVALAVFAFVVVSVSSVIFHTQRSWLKQRIQTNLIQDSRWAMDFMVDEIRQGELQFLGDITYMSEVIRYIILDSYPNGGTDTFYFRYHDKLYRTEGGNFAVAWSNKVELANYLYNNTSNTIFTNPSAGLYVINITMDKGGQLYNIRSSVRPRNP